MENWQKIEDLFAAALEEPEGSRTEFLRKNCGGDESLVAEVRSLLDAHDEPEDLIEKNSIDLAGNVASDRRAFEGRQFGNYKIVREIGRGGMGAVFLAERTDGEFEQKVALKVVRQTFGNAELERRFRVERQILAGLNHPNIARLLDGGVSEMGEPFLAMEYVEGESLLEYAEQNRLSTGEKLELFINICSAVSYAHRNLVVHRDIKPSNILVIDTGEPKLLDFGLAKALEPDAAKTQTDLRAFTPAYASPEQIKGKNITTASDIYSLGVVFYELLTGIKPLNFENKSFEEIVHTLDNTEPIKPSSLAPVTDRDASNQHLRGDLDNIALTALRKEPERRFGSVEDLAADIRRHLDGRPISARPNTTRYLAGKFVRRNKIAIAAAAVILVSLVTGLAFSLWQANRVRQERDRAEKRFQEVRHLSNSLLFEISPKIERLPGSIEARELLVQRALEYLDSLAAESQTDMDLMAELASAYEKVGDLQGNIDKPNLSDLTGAISSFEKARTIRERLKDDPENRFRLAQNFKVTGMIRHRQNDQERALADTARAKQILGDLISASPDSFDLRIASIETDIERGHIYSNNNQYSEAVPLFLDAANALKNMDQSQRKTIQLTAKSHAYMGNALSWDGRQPEAEAQMAVALTVSEKLGAEFASDSEIQSTVWMAYTLASSIYEDSQNDLSLELARRALATAERAVEADKADSQARYNLARAFSRIGIMLAKLGAVSDAVTNLRRSEQMFNELIEKEPKNVIYQRDIGKLYVRLGDVSEKQRNVADALLKYQNSAVVFERLANADAMNALAHRDLAQSLRSVGKMQIALGQIPHARATFHRAKEILDGLKAKNALGGFDQKLVDEIEKILAEI